MTKKTIRDVELKGKRILLRAEFNVPMKDGVITNDSRIQAELSTIRYILEQGAGLVIMTHLGRPKGKPSPEFQCGTGGGAICRSCLDSQSNSFLTGIPVASSRQPRKSNPAKWLCWKMSVSGKAKRRMTQILAVCWLRWAIFMSMTPLAQPTGPMAPPWASVIICRPWQDFLWKKR